jgi:predicted ABC-type ATPase
MGETPRLRMFAGPNGSGKSTLKDELPTKWLGHYLNADEIQREMTHEGFDVSGFPFRASLDEIAQFWATTTILPFIERKNVPSLRDERIFLDSHQASYGASAIAEFLRQKLIESRATFSFETVMSHKNKVDLLQEAKRIGYRTYLYFICTDDPAINVARVAARVAEGGHPVPEQKIRDRYYRTLELLANAIKASDRAYLFDNSRENESKVWIAEFTEGAKARFKVDPEELPAWFLNSIGTRIFGAD